MCTPRAETLVDMCAAPRPVSVREYIYAGVRLCAPASRATCPGAGANRRGGCGLRHHRRRPGALLCACAHATSSRVCVADCVVRQAIEGLDYFDHGRYQYGTKYNARGRRRYANPRPRAHTHIARPHAHYTPHRHSATRPCSLARCMYVCTCVRMYACMYVCMYVCVYVCVYVCMCSRMMRLTQTVLPAINLT